jgi:hypothetical protein
VHFHIEKLLQFSTRYTLHRWHALGLCFQGLRAEGQHGVAAAADALVANDSSPRPFSVMHRDLLATVSDRWVDEATIARAQSGFSGWCAPEVLRVSGELELRRGGADTQTKAEARFLEALEHARAQRALAWELRYQSGTPAQQNRTSCRGASTSRTGLRQLCGRTSNQ